MKNIFIVLFIIVVTPCLSKQKNKKLKSGHWKTELYLTKNNILPFLVEYSKTNNSFIIKNATERIVLKNIVIKNNVITIKFPIFNSEFIGTIISKKQIKGYWHNYAKGNNYKIPFKSFFTKDKRYNTQQNNSTNFVGKWEVTFDYDNSKEKAIGLFEEKNNLLHGTFLTETGDYRFLEGVCYNNNMSLSCFDGSHAFLFNAELKNDTLWGDFLSGSHYKTNWYAVKNKNFELSDPEKLTFLVNNKPLDFSFLSLNDNFYSYPNQSTKNKVVLVQILGTWCPNCMDETNYLTSIYSKFANEIEIIAVGFEIGDTETEKIKRLKNYKKQMNINYNIVLGGDASKPCAQKAFPMLNDIISFPTLIFIDKKGKIRKIHTGFSGPSTGQYYTNFVKHTTKFIENLIAEN